MNMLIAAAVGIVLAFVGGGWLGYDYRDAKVAKDEVKRQTLAQEIRDANRDFAVDVAAATENAIKGIRVTNRTINNEIRQERVIQTVLNDPNCTYPDSTVRVLNRARGHADSGPGTAKPAPAVPTDGTGKGKAADGRPR